MNFEADGSTETEDRGMPAAELSDSDIDATTAETDAAEHDHADADEAEAEADVENGDDERADEQADEQNDLAGAPEVLQPALRRRGFESLTTIQRAVVDAEQAHRDLRISSQTGSGKTVAIGFALLDGLHAEERNGPTTLVIAPTRELAMQVKDELGWLFADLRDVNCEVVTGGTNIERERMRLRRRPNVLVGTPGRLLDHARRGGLDLSAVQQLVLDEADQMLDLGFKDELDAILDHLPEQRRTHLVSATFPPMVLDLADRFQQAPLEIAGAGVGEAHADIEHVACRIHSRETYQAVVNLLLMTGEERTLVFVRTREDTARMADKLAGDGIAAMPLNGDLAQAQRTRTLNAFKNGTIRTLVATDVAARGIDVPSVTMVIHVEPPIDSATYVHRSGRTGRAGQKGRSVMLIPKARAGRCKRIYREADVEPRWASPPTAEAIRGKQLERAEAAALHTLQTAPVATPQRRAAAANLLRERDPVEVVAVLLGRTMNDACKPFELKPSPAPAPKRAPRTFERDDRGPRDSGTLGARRGTPGAAPSWQQPRGEQRHGDDGPRGVEEGFTRFRINWGTRDGADARRILAHVCRRGDINSRLIGSISLSENSSTFDVDDRIANAFGKRVQVRDRRDPHLFIKPERYAGATRTRQSR